MSYQLYAIAIMAIRLSVLLFHRRIFSTPQFRYWLLGVGAVVIAWLFANNLTAASQCNPPRKFWQQGLAGSCMNPLTFEQAIHIANNITEASILALPISGVLRLQMSRIKNVSVLAIFLLGWLVSFQAFIHLHSFSVIYYLEKKSTVLVIVWLVVLVNESLDDITCETKFLLAAPMNLDSNVLLSTDSTGKCSWTVVEPAVEVLSACLPTMAPFLNGGRNLSKLRSSLRSLFSSHKSYQSIRIVGRRGHYSGGLDKNCLGPDRIAEMNPQLKQCPLARVDLNRTRSL